MRVCPLLGFVDEGETRVGCLAHPAVTGGPDLRDCGVYDARICESFLCPSFSWLGEEEAAIAEDASGDFHLYGLVVTDVPFLRAVLAAVADGAGARVERRHLSDPRFRAALRRLLELKTQLAPGSEGLFGAFAAGPGGEDVPRRIDYGAIGRGLSRYDAILTCAGADPRSGNDLDRLEAEVRRRLDACVAAYPCRDSRVRAGPAAPVARPFDDERGEPRALLRAERGVHARDRLREPGAELRRAPEPRIERGPDPRGVERRRREELGEIAAERARVVAQGREHLRERVRLREDGVLLLGGGADAPEDAAGAGAAVMGEAPPGDAARHRGGEEDGCGAERAGEERGHRDASRTGFMPGACAASAIRALRVREEA